MTTIREDMFADTTGKVSAGGVLTVDGINRHPRLRQLHGPSFRGTYMLERGRWQARSVIASSLAHRLGRGQGELLKEHSLLESARHDPVRQDPAAQLNSVVRLDAPREPSGTAIGRTYALCKMT